jgi:hypothetical protein
VPLGSSEKGSASRSFLDGRDAFLSVLGQVRFGFGSFARTARALGFARRASKGLEIRHDRGRGRVAALDREPLNLGSLAR